MLIILYRDSQNIERDLYIYEGVDLIPHILFDFHFFYLAKTGQFDIYKELKKAYFEELYNFILIVRAESIKLLKSKKKREQSTYTVYDSPYLKVIYHNKTSVKIKDSVFYTTRGYLEFIGYDKLKNEVYRAYLIDEGELIPLLHDTSTQSVQ